jgi:hypothetical protein
VRPKILLDEDHAGRAGLCGNAERSGERGAQYRRHHRRWDGADVGKIQGDGQQRVSRCGEGEGEQSGVVSLTIVVRSAAEPRVSNHEAALYSRHARA